MELTPFINDLFKAAQSGDAARLQGILESHPQLANTENGQGLTPLGYAAHFGNKDAVQVLLNYGADVNAVSHSSVSYIPSNTALHAAIAGERNADVIKLLLEHGAQTNIFDSNGHTCLHSAAFHDDNIELIRLLIEHGAEVNARIEGGETALALAIGQGNVNVAELLREFGALH
ncbi:ankyrin repeat domain-containing protein [Paenibacillus sp. NEAU-GSW1]|uniref:ankyrin repeat domain-containing protein n=1 Tax=Paenibacillus sp. NEAU-GSW1 TaxID=2682486 RepID=UPI0012E0DDFC|nr:ankyrin repeat domain-containing protein [Paenibacillus sp. NEAU-GSW1]MUT65234.1 ankyrin repeat domain-containing protein [Paenibacillus sp. NEAU-GSW1]